MQQLILISKTIAAFFMWQIQSLYFRKMIHNFPTALYHAHIQLCHLKKRFLLIHVIKSRNGPGCTIVIQVKIKRKEI